VCFTTTALFGLLVLVAVATSGCSLAKGRDMAERPEVFAAMRSMDFVFDSTLLSTEYGVNTSQVIVTGPMGGPQILNDPAKNGNLKCPYNRVVLDKREGKWVLSSAAKK
jgi:hypothetical protein